MKAVQWNKKEDLLAEQALRHLKAYAEVLGTFSSSRKIELELLKTIQEYCYDNMNFMKLFQKIIMLLYKSKWNYFETFFLVKFLFRLKFLQNNWLEIVENQFYSQNWLHMKYLQKTKGDIKSFFNNSKVRKLSE